MVDLCGGSSQDLIKEIKGEVSGHFEMACVALLKTPTEYDAEELREAMQVGGATGGANERFSDDI